MADFQERIDQATARAGELEVQMSDPAVAKQAGQMQKIAKELGRLRPLVETGGRYQAVIRQIDDARAMADEGDPELAELARGELEELEVLGPGHDRPARSVEPALRRSQRIVIGVGQGTHEAHGMLRVSGFVASEGTSSTSLV